MFKRFNRSGSPAPENRLAERGRGSSVKPAKDIHDALAAAAQAGPDPDAKWSVALDLSKFPLWNLATRMPSPKDVKQGGVGDCWILATLAAIAHTAPEYLKYSVHLQPNGRYLVHLDRPVEVGPIVDCYHSGEGTAAKAMHAGFTGAAWVAVMEKALARRNPRGQRAKDPMVAESYDVIDLGYADTVMELLGWKGVTTIKVEPKMNRSALVEEIQEALNAKRLVVASIREDGGSHAYAVLSTTGTRFLLYNPHGWYEDMSAGDFAASAWRVVVSGENPKLPRTQAPSAAPSAVPSAAQSVAALRNRTVPSPPAPAGPAEVSGPAAPPPVPPRTGAPPPPPPRVRKDQPPPLPPRRGA